MAREPQIRQEDVGVAEWALGDDDAIRAGIAQMPPGSRRDAAINEWQRARVYKEQQRGPPSAGRELIDQGRAAFRGVPFIGGFGDEITAGVNALPEPVGRPGGYDEAIAYWRARDKQFGREHPVADTALGLAGGAAVPPVVRGLGMMGNVLYNTAGGAISGFGEGEGSPLTEAGLKSRAGSGAAAGVGTGVLSTLMGPASRYINRYSLGNVTPEVEAAINRLGVNANNVPYFVRAADELTQAQGRRNAQVNVGTPLNRAYGDVRDEFGTAAGNIVARGAGAGVTPQAAPWQTGQTIDAALRRSAAGAQQSRGVLAEETNRLMPPGAQFDPAGQRAALDEVIRERASTNMPGPGRGLGDHMAFATAPTSWEGSNAYTTRLGQAIGLPQTDASNVARSELQRLYAGHQGVDRPNFVEQILGPAGRARFEAAVAEQERLGNLQRGITAMLRANPTPEQLVSALLASGSTRGGPTNLNAFNMIMGSLSPSEQRQAAAGVLSVMINQGQVQAPRGVQAGTVTNPGAVANAINRLVPEARNRLFPQTEQFGGDVDALRLLGQRIGQVNQFQNVGSAATLGNSMQQVPALGSVLRSAAKVTMLPQVKSAIDNYLALHGMPAGLATLTNQLAASGARLGGAGAGPYVAGAAPYVYDQATQLKNQLVR
jgi:hypothetical protein